MIRSALRHYYTAERLFITARGGTEIPVTLVYRKDQFNKDGTNPLYQYGYGFIAQRLNPKERAYYDDMLSYSPYDQIKRQDSPNLLVTTGLHDSQVQYFEPAILLLIKHNPGRAPCATADKLTFFSIILYT